MSDNQRRAIVDDLPWSEPEEETGDSTAAAIVRGMSREERERMAGISPAIRRWFERIAAMQPAERETVVGRMASVDRERFHRWRELATAA